MEKSVLPDDFSACSCSDQLVNQKLSLQHPQPLDSHFQSQGDTGCMVQGNLASNNHGPTAVKQSQSALMSATRLHLFAVESTQLFPNRL